MLNLQQERLPDLVSEEMTAKGDTVNKMSISVIVNATGLTSRLGEVLESLKGFDEVVVWDKRKPIDTSVIDEMKGSWVLLLDADEVVPAELRLYLYHYIHDDPKRNALWIPRRNYLMGRRNSARFTDYRLRFFRKGFVAFTYGKDILPRISGKVGKIPANKSELALMHDSPKVGELVGLVTNDVENMDTVRGKVGLLRLLGGPTLTFMNSYFMRGGILNGAPGFIYSAHRASRHFYSLAAKYENDLE